MDCILPGSSACGDSPGKTTEVGCHALLQGMACHGMSNLDSVLKCREITLPTNVHIVKVTFFLSSHVWSESLSDEPESLPELPYCPWDPDWARRPKLFLTSNSSLQHHLPRHLMIILSTPHNKGEFLAHLFPEMIINNNASHPHSTQPWIFRSRKQQGSGEGETWLELVRTSKISFFPLLTP